MASTKSCWIFAAQLESNGQALSLAVIVSRNTRLGEKPWRLTLINGNDSEAVLPHLQLDAPVTEPEKIIQMIDEQRRNVPNWETGRLLVCA